MSKQETITTLVTNCSCLKGQEAALNALSDDAVEGLGDIVEALADHAGVINTLRTELALDDGITLNAMPAAVKGKMKKGKCDDDEDEDDMTGNMTTTKWLSLMPEEAKPVWNSAVKAHDKEKADLIDSLLVNAGADKDARKVKLQAKTLDQLKELADLFPVANAGQTQRTDGLPDYYGGAGGSTGGHTQQTTNAANQFVEPPLPLPSYAA